MDRIRRWLVRQLSRRAGRYLRSYGLLRTVRHAPALVWEPGAGRILVLAPHMDDEVIGCGGTLAKHVRQGARVTVVYLTDGRSGSASLQDLGREERREGERELVEARKKEARLAMSTLGVQEGIFLDVADWKLASADHLQGELRRILESVRPELVYLPFFLEEHPDHRATSRILTDATADTGFTFDCLAYEVWTPLFPNCLVEISDTLEIKKEALMHYRTQLADHDYLHTVLGLNAYRSIALSGNHRGFVEAFYMAPLASYRELYRTYARL